MTVNTYLRKKISCTFLLMATSIGAAQAAADDTPAPPLVTTPVIGIITPDTNQWNDIAFVNVKTFPFDGTEGSAIKRPPLGPTSKTIFQSPEAGPGSDLPVGQLIHLEYPPTTNAELPPPGMPSHFHHFYEWGYTIKGDSIMPEPVSPDQENGMLYRKREGGWLTRPPYSLHGGSWATGGLRNQLPYELIIFEEGDGHLVVAGKDGGPGKYLSRNGKPPINEAYGDYRTAKRFTRPWLVDSLRDLDWEVDTEVPGRFVKWLDDDTGMGFRSRLIKIPAGWEAPANNKSYFERANRLRYMVWGDMKVWQFKNPADSGKAFKVVPGYFIYQPPRSIWGQGPGAVTERGAIWLEVTYANGLKHGVGPIEQARSAR